MKNKVIATPYFVSRFKKFRNKLISMDEDIAGLEKELLINPHTGQSLGANLYKVRLSGKGKGKSGGFRVITYILKKLENGFEIYLITIYDKSEESTILKKDLIQLVKNIFER
jgi:hypothetical protein